MFTPYWHISEKKNQPTGERFSCRNLNYVGKYEKSTSSGEDFSSVVWITTENNNVQNYWQVSVITLCKTLSSMNLKKN